MDKTEEFIKELAGLCRKYDARIDIAYDNKRLEICVDEESCVTVSEVDGDLHERHY